MGRPWCRRRGSLERDRPPCTVTPYGDGDLHRQRLRALDRGDRGHDPAQAEERPTAFDCGIVGLEYRP
jgi:hypothetical protein